jgi:Caspase recruitment domain
MDCATQIVRLEKGEELLRKVHDELKALCRHTVQSLAYTNTAGDLGRRLELVTRDVEVAIEITQHCISHEKVRQKSHDIHGAVDQSRELHRRLERAEEELKLRKAVTEVTNLRREEEANSLSECGSIGSNRSIGSVRSIWRSQQPSSEKLDQMNKNRLMARLQTNRDWLVSKIIAPSVAAHMYQQNALTLQEYETIMSCSDTPTKAAEKLIKIVEDQPYPTLRCLKDALKETKQNDVFMTLADIGMYCDIK